MELAHYRILQEIGQGGHGRVFLAEDTRLGTQVALKVLSAPGKSKQIAQRIVREGRILASLRSEHIVEVFETGVAAGDVPYVAMEYLEGNTLAERVMNQGPLEPKDVLRIVFEIGKALSVAHLAGVIHRDLKPENILLVGGSQMVKVLDFGVATFIDQTPLDDGKSLTALGKTMGTLHYMSPEHLRGKPLGDASDLFCVGLLIYWMVNGVHPFSHIRNPLELLRAYKAESYPPLDRDLPGGQLGELVKALLRYESDARISPASKMNRFIGFRP